MLYDNHMLQPINITAREMARNYKSVIEQVHQTKQPVIVQSQDQGEVAIVPLEALEKLQQMKDQQSAQALLNLAQEAEALPAAPNAPTDVSTNHDYYAWEKDKLEQ